MGMDEQGDELEVLYEFNTIGGVVRVAAVDAASGLEVKVLSPASAGEAALRLTARRKLLWALQRRRRTGITATGGRLRV